MMKKVCLIGLMVWLLAGCAAPVWETVEDVLPAVETAAWQETAYTIQLGLPEGAVLTEETETCRLYTTPGDNLEIQTETFLASGLDDAVRHLSGMSAENLTILKTQRFSLPEYQFVWYAQSEEGGWLCRADLVIDGLDCYAVVCRSRESGGNDREQTIRQVFSTFGLFRDEGV